MPAHLMDITGYGPSFWRTATLRAISSEAFWTPLLRSLSRHLQGRQRHTLRSHTSALTGKMEQALQQGKVRSILQAVLQEEAPMFTMETLTVPGIGMITDGRELHNMASKHFLEWYARDPALYVDWAALLTSSDSFLTHTRARGIPDALGQVLWQAITHVPQAALVRHDLDIALAEPPTLADFARAIQHLGPSTSPGATGLTYNMVRGWPPEVVA